MTRDTLAPLRSAHVWTPLALIFWRMPMRTSALASEKQRRDPRHSLARWATIEEAVDRLYAVRTK